MFSQGESPLHTACIQGLAKLVKTLLEGGANPNAQTSAPLEGQSGEQEGVFKHTPLHLAISNKHEPVVRVFLDYKSKQLPQSVIKALKTSEFNTF